MLDNVLNTAEEAFVTCLQRQPHEKCEIIVRPATSIPSAWNAHVADAASRLDQPTEVIPAEKEAGKNSIG